MAHIWVRAEQRAHEQRVGLSPQGVTALIEAGHSVTVEHSSMRAIPIESYTRTGCAFAPEHSWITAPKDVIVFGLKELDPDGPDLCHRHIMFGHAYKGQSDGPHLLARFKRGGGTLLDLEYLTDDSGRRVAAFGYWAGYAGAALGLMAWIAQCNGTKLGPVDVYAGKDALLADLEGTLAPLLKAGTSTPKFIVIGAKGRVGTGACDLCAAMGLPATKWDMDETRHGGPFPEILEHVLFVNCILAGPQVPVFVPGTALESPRTLRVIADVSCDPNSSYNPIPIYDRSTTFADPVIRVAGGSAPLDVMAVDNLPSLLPVESSLDYASQLLPFLMQLDDPDTGVWGRAQAMFHTHCNDLVTN